MNFNFTFQYLQLTDIQKSSISYLLKHLISCTMTFLKDDIIKHLWQIADFLVFVQKLMRLFNFIKYWQLNGQQRLKYNEYSGSLWTLLSKLKSSTIWFVVSWKLIFQDWIVLIFCRMFTNSKIYWISSWNMNTINETEEYVLTSYIFRTNKASKFGRTKIVSTLATDSGKVL